MRLSSLGFVLGVFGYAAWGTVGYPLSIREAAVTQQVTAAQQVTVAQVQRKLIDPWDKGLVLHYLFFTANAEERAAANRFVAEFALSDTDVAALRRIAAESYVAVRALSKSATEAKIEAIGATADQNFRTVVGDKYTAMRKWLLNWQAEILALRETQMREGRSGRKAETQNPVAKQFNSAAAAASTNNWVYVYATQFASSGWDVAIPDWQAKFATLGWCCVASPPYNYPPYPAPYSIAIYYSGSGVTINQAWVKDVGPWNENDNYWDSSADGTYNRRRCEPRQSTADDFIPQSYLAYYYGNNGGYSCTLYGGGRQFVGNPAGIDLQPDLAGALGLGYLQNAWMWAKFDKLP